jgi:cytidylate kinase
MHEVIIFSGLAGVGTTTLSKDVARMLGRERFTAGPYFRNKGAELGIALEDTLKFPREFHREVDEIMYGHMMSGQKVVIEGWFQGVNAFLRKVESDRIYVACLDKTRFSRIAPRDNVTKNQARKINLEREAQNMQMFDEIYGVNDFTDPKYYTLRLCSERMNQKELAIHTLARLGLLDQIVAE